MQNPAETDLSTGRNLPGAFKGKIADCDKPFRFQDANNFPQMIITRGEQRRPLICRQFVGRSIAPALFTKGEWAIIHHHVFLEEFLGGTKAFREQSP